MILTAVTTVCSQFNLLPSENVLWCVLQEMKYMLYTLIDKLCVDVVGPTHVVQWRKCSAHGHTVLKWTQFCTIHYHESYLIVYDSDLYIFVVAQRFMILSPLF